MNVSSWVSDRSRVWIIVTIAACFLYSAVCLGFGGTAKNLSVGIVFLIFWSFGLVMLPAPEGYGAAIYGGWAILAMIFVMLYFEYEKSRKRKTVSQKKQAAT